METQTCSVCFSDFDLWHKSKVQLGGGVKCGANESIFFSNSILECLYYPDKKTTSVKIPKLMSVSDQGGNFLKKKNPKYGKLI